MLECQMSEKCCTGTFGYDIIKLSERCDTGPSKTD